MPQIYVNVDLDEVYSDLSSSEKRELVDWLTDDGYINEPEHHTDNSLHNEDFDFACRQLSASYYRLTPEEESIIIAIVKKYN